MPGVSVQQFGPAVPILGSGRCRDAGQSFSVRLDGSGGSESIVLLGEVFS